LRGRKYDLFYDGGKLRLVAWRSGKASYWVSNTLSESLSNKQMLGIATLADASRPLVNSSAAWRLSDAARCRLAPRVGAPMWQSHTFARRAAPVGIGRRPTTRQARGRVH